VSAVIGLLVALATTTPAVAPVKVPIFLQSNAEDTVGAAYVNKLREALAASTIYRPVTKPADAQFVIGIVTMDPNEAELGSGAGHSTVASVTLQLENAKGLNYVVYSWVLIANRDKVDSLATDLLAAIDREIQELPITN
jgi:hypothetical protein